MLADELTELGAPRVLVTAALERYITGLECAMPECLCPEGRGYFERCGSKRYARWAPSADRHPVAARDGGTYVPTNVRLTHVSCNVAEGGRLAVGALRAFEATPEGREHSKGRGEALRQWSETPEGREHRARLDARMRSDHEIAVSTARILAWRQSPEGKAVAAAKGRRWSCNRWNIQRGKPCTCGTHATAAAAPVSENVTVT